MNNSDSNDFNKWQNGDDENELNNPNNWINKGGFFYYGPPSEGFKKLWNSMNNNEDYMDHMKDYLNMDDIMNQFHKQNYNKSKRNYKTNKSKITTFSQEDYFKLIEIRGYLAITEQFAHVKALDKLLNQITILPKDNK
jgi:hypothetical protein